MPCCGSQSNTSKPEPSSRHSLAVPSSQLAAPGVHCTQPSVSTSPRVLERDAMQVSPRSAQSIESLYPPSPSQISASEPSQCT
jgi:hypothetical protein